MSGGKRRHSGVLAPNMDLPLAAARLRVGERQRVRNAQDFLTRMQAAAAKQRDRKM